MSICENKEIKRAKVSILIQNNYYISLYALLKSAEFYYPEFKKWYMEKVIPSLPTDDREVIFEYRNSEVAGMAIIKKSENKLCTLKVMEKYKNKGIGLKLFEKSFNALNTRKPFLTVSEEKLIEFKTIFEHYNFQCTSVHNNLYRKNKKEYFFNE